MVNYCFTHINLLNDPPTHLLQPFQPGTTGNSWPICTYRANPLDLWLPGGWPYGSLLHYGSWETKGNTSSKWAGNWGLRPEMGKMPGKPATKHWKPMSLDPRFAGLDMMCPTKMVLGHEPWNLESSLACDGKIYIYNYIYITSSEISGVHAMMKRRLTPTKSYHFLSSWSESPQETWSK